MHLFSISGVLSFFLGIDLSFTFISFQYEEFTLVIFLGKISVFVYLGNFCFFIIFEE